MKKEKKLMLFNGRWGADTRKHIYIGAYSVADACRILDMVAGHTGSWRKEINEYFGKCWGYSMEGIKPERGAWISDDYYNEKPHRVELKE